MLSSDKELVKERIQDYRKIRRITQTDMAAYLNMKRGSYQFRESHGDFKWEEIEMIAELFDTSPYFLKYGFEEEDLKKLAKLLHAPHRFHEPNYTVFDNLEQKPEIDRLFESFMNLSQEDQKRIKRYIESQNY
ncbi:MAG: helix-turn-helix transcriptional regulator [Acutalibacteraceae bacterium]|nr:helix-turn-helix transcriptional regulator [Acutalibacteraceae bacterium]